MEKELLIKFEDLVFTAESNTKFKEQVQAMTKYDNYIVGMEVYRTKLLELIFEAQKLQLEVMLKNKRKKLFGIF